MTFDEIFYRQKYLDVAEAIAAGHFLSGRQHFFTYGQAEGRIGYQFDSEWYLKTYPHAASELNNEIKTLRQHYEMIGSARGWAACPPVPDHAIAAMIVHVPELKPVILTFAPRSGSTFLMDILANHRNVVVAERYPYEVRVAGYYAHAVHVLTSKADHAQSGSPSEFMRRHHLLSFNPFNHAEFSNIFSDPALGDMFFGHYSQAAITDLCRRLAIDYYRLLAADHAPEARFFAEKCELDFRLRAILRTTFPDSREIVMVRDLRDLYCSYRRYFGQATSDETCTIIANAGRMLLLIKEWGEHDILFLRYEDCMADASHAPQQLGTFLGLSFDVGAPAGQSALFERHATSASPMASVGRWKNDLAGDEYDQFKRATEGMLMRYNTTFGYM